MMLSHAYYGGFTISVIARIELGGYFRCNYADYYKYAISRK
jgi:hypothetical protein